MAKYQCPRCEAVLRRAEAVAEGKKIRCPKCETVFKAVLMPDDEEPAPAAEGGYAVAGVTEKPKRVPGKVYMDDEENSDPYAVIRETGDDAPPEVFLGSLRDKFAKSKIGPAMFKTVIPSNWLLRLGLFSCVCATFTFIYGIWPVIFCEANPIKPFIRPRVTIMWQAALMFSFGAIMCLGAARMHDLTSYAWAIVGSTMSLIIYIPAGISLGLFMLLLFGLPGLLLSVICGGLALVGLWCLIVLMNPAVRDGFKERAEELA